MFSCQNGGEQAENCLFSEAEMEMSKDSLIKLCNSQKECIEELERVNKILYDALKRTQIELAEVKATQSQKTLFDM